MFAPHIAKGLTKAAGNRVAPQILGKQSTALFENGYHGKNGEGPDPASLSSRGAMHNVSWDFSKLPLRPPERASQFQQSYSLATTPVPRAPQTDIVVGQVDDPLECEADRVADQVMRMPDPNLPIGKQNPNGSAGRFERMPTPGTDSPSILQRKCAQCAEDEKQKQAPRADETQEPEQAKGTGIAVSSDMPPVQPPTEEDAARKDEGPLAPTVRAPETIRRMRAGGPNAPGKLPATLAGTPGGPGSGQPLDVATRSFFEPRFEHSFAHVRVHTDTRAADSAAAVHALAYTAGSNIVFAAGQYAPDSQSGRRLLAHELTHVVQQGGEAPRSAATAAMAVQLHAGVAGVIQRWSADGPADPSINTIVCDGAGDVRVQIGTGNDAKKLPCMVDCMRKHEGSHRADALAADPSVCKRQANGSQVNMKDVGEQKPSEFKASQVEIDCLNAKLPAASKACDPAIRRRITQMIAYRDSFK